VNDIMPDTMYTKNDHINNLKRKVELVSRIRIKNGFGFDSVRRVPDPGRPKWLNPKFRKI